MGNLYYLLAVQASSFLIHPSFPNTVSQNIFGILPLIVQCLCNLRDAMSRHWSPSTSHPILSREVEDFPRGGKYSTDVPLANLLATNLIINSELIFHYVKIMNFFTYGEKIGKLAF